jgi:hydrogenase maturation protease
MHFLRNTFPEAADRSRLKNMLVIGIGNELRGDDAAGIYAARRIREQNLPDVAAIENSGDGARLMEMWKNQDKVIVFDAAQSEAAPGTLHRYEAHRHSLPADIFGFSTHTIGLAEAIELSRALGELPKSLIVYGIEAKNFEMDHPISPEVHAAIDMLVKETTEALRR